MSLSEIVFIRAITPEPVQTEHRRVPLSREEKGKTKMYSDDDQAHQELSKTTVEPTNVHVYLSQQRSSVSAKIKVQGITVTASSTAKGAFQIKLSNPFSALDLASDTDDDMCLSH